MESVLNNPKIKTSSMDLLLAIILTAVNIASSFVGVGYYFPFSIQLPYEVVTLGYLLAYPESYDETLAGQGFGTVALIVALVIAFVILGIFLVLYLLSRPKAIKTVDQAKRAKGVLIAALVLFCIDTLILLISALLNLNLSGIIDLAFHVWAIVSFVGGIKGYDAAVKEAMSPAAVVEAEAVVTENAQE